MCQLPPFWSLFPPLAIFFTPFLKKCFLPLWGSHFCKSIRCILTLKTHFLDPQAEAKPPMLATVSPQVRHFRYFFATSASFGPLFRPKCVIWATFSTHQSPQHTHNIFQLPLFPPFSRTCKHFDSFFERMLPASFGDHIFANQSGAV